MPASGSAAVMAGSDACSGPALNALCTSHRPTAAVPITAYPGQVVASVAMPCPSRISTLRLVSASAMPSTRPPLAPVKVARNFRGAPRPAMASAAATPAMIAAAGQCENEPNVSDSARTDLLADSAATPEQSRTAPTSSVRRGTSPEMGAASSKAKMRFVASSGSLTVRLRWPRPHADSPWPTTMTAMPPSQIRWRSNSAMSRR